MARTTEWTPFYIRTRDGSASHFDNLEEAIDEFITNEGKVLAFSSNRFEIVIGRDFMPDVEPSSVNRVGLAYVLVQDRLMGYTQFNPNALGERSIPVMKRYGRANARMMRWMADRWEKYPYRTFAITWAWTILSVLAPRMMKAYANKRKAIRVSYVGDMSQVRIDRDARS